MTNGETTSPVHDRGLSPSLSVEWSIGLVQLWCVRELRFGDAEVPSPGFRLGTKSGSFALTREANTVSIVGLGLKFGGA